MESHLPQHLAVVAIEKGAFKSPLTKVANFTYYIYTYVDIVTELWLSYLSTSPLRQDMTQGQSLSGV